MNRSSVRFRQAAPRAPPLSPLCPGHSVRAMPSPRVLITALAAAATLGLASTLSGAAAATADKPVFKTVKLAGSSGRSEPRATVAPNGVHYVVTNATSGDETVYRSPDGIHWSKTAGQPNDQTMPTTDVDIVSMRTGRILTSELDFGGINFRT